MCSVECAWPGVCLNYTLSVESARKSSPCGVNWFGKREKVRPAWEKWLAFGVFGRAGRVFSRFGQGEAVAGRTFSRGNGWRGVLGEFFRGLAKIGLLLGELFRAGTVGGACRESFFARADSCPGLSALSGARWASFFAVWPGLDCCWESFLPVGLLLGEFFRAGMPKWRVARTLLRAGVIQ